MLHTSTVRNAQLGGNGMLHDECFLKPDLPIGTTSSQRMQQPHESLHSLSTLLNTESDVIVSSDKKKRSSPSLSIGQNQAPPSLKQLATQHLNAPYNYNDQPQFMGNTLDLFSTLHSQNTGLPSTQVDEDEAAFMDRFG